MLGIRSRLDADGERRIMGSGLRDGFWFCGGRRAGLFVNAGAWSGCCGPVFEALPRKSGVYFRRMEVKSCILMPRRTVLRSPILRSAA